MMLINKVFIYTRNWEKAPECAAAAAHELGTHIGLDFRRKLLNLTKKSPFVFLRFSVFCFF